MLLVAAAITVACGKKGPPLPPLIKIPIPPGDFTVVRRGTQVELQFTVPNANTDGTRPANVARVEAYAITGVAAAVAPIPDEQLLKVATKVGSVPVKAPRDPDMTIEPDEAAEDIEPPEGAGLDQGAPAHVEEQLTAASLAPVDVPQKRARGPSADTAPRPLLGPSRATFVRTYAIVGVTSRGRKGPVSKRVSVPLVLPPPAPSSPKIDYDETAITLTWSPPAPAALTEGAPGGRTTLGLLAARPLGVADSKIAYHVYDVAPGPDGAGQVQTRLTESPVPETTFTDKRIVWGVERCYVVRTVEIISDLRVESDAAPPACRTLVDTFPPVAPKELNVVPGQGYVSLIWQPNTERDLAGYIVLRGVAPGDALEPITPGPITDTAYQDNNVPTGVRYVYAVRAVDKAGNLSPLSNRQEVEARE
jgi:hypothetical protein